MYLYNKYDFALKLFTGTFKTKPKWNNVLLVILWEACPAGVDFLGVLFLRYPASFQPTKQKDLSSTLPS